MGQAKNYGVSVRDRLKELMAPNLSYQQIIVRYMHERLLYRLSVSRFCDNFYLKGGALLFAYQRFMARPTIDIDFLGDRISRDKETIFNVMTEILSIPMEEDGVTFDVGPGDIIINDIILDKEYNGVRVVFTGHLDTIVQRLSMDIGFGDIIIPKPVKLSYVPLLDGMDEFDVNAYSLETVVAEKFQTMIDKSTANSRMKDFYDVYTILSGGNIDSFSLGIAVHEVMNNRGTHYESGHPLFTDAFKADPKRLIQWNAFLRKTKITNGPSFDEVMTLIEQKLKPYWEAIQ